MFLAMETELSVRLFCGTPKLSAMFMTVQFLVSAGHSGFFDIMHQLTLAQCEIELWERVWEGCQRLEWYDSLKQTIEWTDRTYEAVVPLILETRLIWTLGLWIGLLLISCLKNTMILVHDHLNQTIYEDNKIPRLLAAAPTIMRLRLRAHTQSAARRAPTNDVAMYFMGIRDMSKCEWARKFSIGWKGVKKVTWTKCWHF